MTLGLHIDLNNRWHRFVTVLIYLTDDFGGGMTVFPGASAVVDVGIPTKNTPTKNSPIKNSPTKMKNLNSPKNQNELTELSIALDLLTSCRNIGGHTGNALCFPEYENAARIVVGHAENLARQQE